MRVGYLQYAPRLGETEANTRTVLGALRGVEADLVVLPELAFTGYALGSRERAWDLAQEPRSSPIVEALVGCCGERGLHLVTGFAERDGDWVYNSALVLGPTGLVSVYRKLHLFGEEKRLFDAGGRAPEVVEIDGVKLGVMICFDWAFPETARVLALEGAEIIAHPSNLVLFHAHDAMRTRCIENGVFAITANRFGAEGALHFNGASQVCDPKGRRVLQAPGEGMALEVVDVDPADARSKMITEQNHLLGDRRPECYRRIVER